MSRFVESSMRVGRADHTRWMARKGQYVPLKTEGRNAENMIFPHLHVSPAQDIRKPTSADQPLVVPVAQPASTSSSLTMSKNDPLSLLRDFTISKKPITLVAANGTLVTELTEATDVVFADDKQTFKFPRSTPTNYRRGASDETYTLETLLFLLQRAHLSVAEYSLEGAQKGIQIVSILDKRLVLDYLTGVTATSANIIYLPSETSKSLLRKNKRSE